MTSRFNRGADGTNPLDHSYKPDPNGVVEVLGGDELNTLTETHYPVGIGINRWAERYSAGYFWRFLEGQLAECDRILAEHDWIRTAEKPGNFPGDRSAEPYSDLWYAGKIGVDCWMLLSAGPESALSEHNLARILGIGMRLKDWEWRRQYVSHPGR